MTTGPYGQIVTGRTVRRQALEVLKLWLPGALAEIVRQEDYDGRVPPVRTWNVFANATAARDDQLPAIGVSSDGLLTAPFRKARNLYDADWGITGRVVLRGQTFEETSDLVGLYVAAMRTVLLQRQSLDGLANGTTWIGESYDYSEVAGSATRTLGGGFVEIAVPIDNVIDADAGPDTPPDAEIPDARPTVTDINADVDNVPVNEELTA